MASVISAALANASGMNAASAGGGGAAVSAGPPISISPPPGGSAAGGGGGGGGSALEDLWFTIGNPTSSMQRGRVRVGRQPDVLEAAAAADAGTGTVSLWVAVGVPLRMPPAEFCQFVEAYLSGVGHMRVVRPSGAPGTYALLLAFRKPSDASAFVYEFQDRAYNSLDPEVCTLLPGYEPCLQSHSCGGATAGAAGGDGIPTTAPPMRRAGSQDSTRSRGPDIEVELAPLGPLLTADMEPSEDCMVCLEPVNTSTDCVLSLVCGHRFHAACVMRCEVPSCPICRYCQSCEDDQNTLCEDCSSPDDLWMCLVCGNIGCGESGGRHAERHYQTTLHTYAEELSTQRVWDFAGHGYVHRLLQNYRDGKLVEFADPRAVTGERSSVPPVTDAVLEHHAQGKASSLAGEFNFLLESQLATQRDFFERKLAAALSEDNKAVREARHALTDLDQRLHQVQQSKASVDKDRKALERRLATLQDKIAVVEKDAAFLSQVNGNLKANQAEWRAKIQTLERKAAESTAKHRDIVAAFQRKVSDLMAKLDAQNAASAAAAAAGGGCGTTDTVAAPSGAARSGRK